MARTEARVLATIWTDPEFRAMTPHAQWAYMFLLSQPDLSYAGVLPLRVRRWAASAAGMTTQILAEALRELERKRFIVADRETEELLIRTLLRGDGIFRQPNLVKAARKSLAEVVSPMLRAEIWVEVEKCMAIADNSAKAELEAMAEDLARSSGNPSPNPSGNPSTEGKANPLGEGGGYGGGEGEPLSPFPEPPAPDPSLHQGSPTLGRGKPRAKRTKLPSDFAPTDDMRRWAADRMPTVDVDQQTEVFVNHWRSKGDLRADWPATWRNWILRAPQFAGTGNGRASPHKPYTNPTDPSAYEEGL